MLTSTLAGFGLGAGLRYYRISSRRSRGVFLAVVVFLCWRRSSSSFVVGTTDEVAPPWYRLSKHRTNGGDGSVTMVDKRAVFGDEHQGSYSRFPVLPEAWMDGAAGRCHPTSDVFTWKKWGFGSNINQLLLTWVGQVYEGRTDVALDLTGTTPQGYGLNQVHCSPGAPNAEQQLVGWSCFFKPMRHMCIFHEEKELQQFVAVKDSLELQPGAPYFQLSVNVSDNLVVPSALMGFLYAHMQPWFKEDMWTILEEDDLVSVREGKYVAMHVRRGDKIRHKEAKKVEVQDYFKAAATAIWHAKGGQSGIESITGVLVSSDDPTVLAEARELVASFFPNVRSDNVVSISYRSARDNTENIPTWTTRMTYDTYVLLHTELAMMSAADLFVGTFSSNIARLLYLVREGLGFSRNSTISVDEPSWYAGRRRSA